MRRGYNQSKAAVPLNSKRFIRIMKTESRYQNRKRRIFEIIQIAGGADSPRQVDLRKVASTGKWYVRNHEGLTPDIRKPKSADPWA